MNDIIDPSAATFFQIKDSFLLNSVFTYLN